MSEPTAPSLEGRVVEVILTIRKHLLFPKLMLAESEVYIKWVMLEVVFWEDLVAAQREDAESPQGCIFIWDLKN